MRDLDEKVADDVAWENVRRAPIRDLLPSSLYVSPNPWACGFKHLILPILQRSQDDKRVFAIGVNDVLHTSERAALSDNVVAKASVASVSGGVGASDGAACSIVASREPRISGVTAKIEKHSGVSFIFVIGNKPINPCRQECSWDFRRTDNTSERAGAQDARQIHEVLLQFRRHVVHSQLESDTLPTGSKVHDQILRINWRC